MDRRLAAIVAADVVGYSRLMDEDELGTLAALKTHRAEFTDPIITRHRGRIVKLMGDGVLIEFGSVFDALECAVEIQRGMRERNAVIPEDRRIVFRIGINLGDVIIDGDDIYGNGVNVAARLEALAEPGGICISGRVLDQVEKNVEVGYAYLGPQTIKNIDRPVNAYKVLLESEAVGTILDAPKGTTPGRHWLAVAALTLLLVAGGVGLWFYQTRPELAPASVARMAQPLPDKPSIAVLPFTNMSDDSSQEYFVDGMTEDLITDLSKVSDLFVIARNSVFTYKGRPVKVGQVAEELGVRYVLEGSVRRSGDQVRINAQLIDAITGGHLWADRYDGYMVDVFELQDQVTRKIVAALEINLTDAAQGAWLARRNNNPQAYDAFLKGWEHYQRFSADEFVKARPYFEKAIQLDPTYGQAYAALASLYWESIRQGESWTLKVSPNAAEASIVSRGQSRNNADNYLQLALQYPTPLAHQIASAAHWDYRQFDDAISEAVKAVTLDPNDPAGHVALAWAMLFNGDAHAALDAVEQAKRLDPRNPGSVYLYVRGLALMFLDRHQDALTDLQIARERSPDYLDVNLALAAAYARLGHAEEARAALLRYQETWRNFATNFDGILGRWPLRREEDVRNLGDALIMSGAGSHEELNEYVDLLRLGGTLD